MHSEPTAAAPRVLLFTESFPAVGEHEPFIAAEVAELARTLRLVVIPLSRGANGTVPVPRGVEVEWDLADHMAGARPRLASLLKSLGRRETYREIYAFGGRAIDPRVIAAVLVRSSRMVRSQSWARAYLETADRVVAYSWWSSMAGYGIAKAARECGVRSVSRIHGYELYPEQDRLGRIPFQGAGLAGFDGVYSVSKAGADYLRDQYPELALRIHVARLGVAAPPDIGGPSSDGVFRIVSCSTCIPIKRVELLASGVVALRRMFPSLEFTWTHIGDGPTLASVRAAVSSEEGLAERCIFTGQLPHAEVRFALAGSSFDVFVNVSSSEGLPVTRMEAASSAIPMIATRVGGNPEIVDEACGRLLPADPTPNDLATALAEIAFLTPDERAATRAASRNRWATDFCAERNYRAFGELLGSVAAQ